MMSFCFLLVRDGGRNSATISFLNRVLNMFRDYRSRNLPMHATQRELVIITGVSQAPCITERLILRRWHGSDRVPFARMNADPRVMEFFPALLSREESDCMVDRIEAHFDGHGFGSWAAELRRDGTFVGFVGLNIPTFDAPCSLHA
jgi:RimJ/RimL family protein N-acetyltransferase